MNLNDTIHQLKKIESVAVEIMLSDFSEEIKFDMIFSTNISKKVFQLFKETPISFDYYDPDTSYEEDSQAFVSALTEHIERLDEIYIKNKVLYDRFEAL